MTTLKTIKEVAKKWHEPEVIEDVLTEDRQAIADVLCAKLEEVESVGDDYNEGYNQGLTKAQDIIRATLSENLITLTDKQREGLFNLGK